MDDKVLERKNESLEELAREVLADKPEGLTYRELFDAVRDNDFEKVISVYESLLAIDPQDDRASAQEQT